jgi:hypothetical protein
MELHFVLLSASEIDLVRLSTIHFVSLAILFWEISNVQDIKTLENLQHSNTPAPYTKTSSMSIELDSITHDKLSKV